MVGFMVKFPTTFMFTFLKMIEKWKSLKIKNGDVDVWREEEEEVSIYKIWKRVYNIFIGVCFITGRNSHPNDRENAP